MSRVSSIPYMRWAKAHAGEGEFPLTASAVPPLSWQELGFEPSRLELYDYSPYGSPVLLEGIAAAWGRDGSEVLLASSATHANFCFAASRLSPGDRILFESPGYLPLVDSLSLLDVEAIRFRRRFEDGYALPVDEISQRVDNLHPRLLLVTHLHNPSGVALSGADIDFLVELCDRTDIEVLSDETYRPFLSPDPGPLALKHPSLISVWGLNKVHGLPMIRVGWGMAPPARVDDARRIIDATTVHNSCLSDQVARFALGRLEHLVERAQRIAAAGRGVIVPWLERSPFPAVLPPAGIICFPHIPEALFENGEALRRALLGVGVGVTPGRHFGEPRHFRLSFGRPPAELEVALDRIDRVLGEAPR